LRINLNVGCNGSSTNAEEASFPEIVRGSRPDRRWQTLIINAHALSDAAGDRRREDFSPREMTEGMSLYFQQEDNLSGKATYRMRIRSASPDREVFDT
jgi:hypothetical protein